jgi:hypothetical protein
MGSYLHSDNPAIGDLTVMNSQGWNFGDNAGGHGGLHREEKITVMIASGPGIASLARRLGIAEAAVVEEWLPGALDARRPEAQRLLGLCVEPIANMLRALWCLDPHLDRLGLGGGVIEVLCGHYAGELRRQLATATSYADRGRDEAWLDDRLVFCGAGQVDALRGAEQIGRWLPGIVP